jgi:serine protease Do
MRKTIASALIPAALTLAICLQPRPASAQETRRLPRFNAPLLVQPAGSTIGVGIRDITADEASKAKIADGAGVWITEVRSGTPAARAGIAAGDIVVEFDGFPVRSAAQFGRLVSETAPGRTVKATVVRDGNRRTLDVTPAVDQGGLRDDLRAFPEDRLFRMPLPRAPLAGPQRRIGTTLLPLNDQLANYFGVKQGVLVSSVDQDSPAAKAGLKAGDVIIGINGTMVTDPESVREAVGRAGSTELEVSIVRERRNQTIRIPASS